MLRTAHEGFDAHLVKPADINDIDAALEKLETNVGAAPAPTRNAIAR